MFSEIFSVISLNKIFLAQISPSLQRKDEDSDKGCEERFREYESSADYEEFIRKYPSCPQISEAWWRVGRRFEQKRDLSSAIKAYKNAAKVISGPYGDKSKPFGWIPAGYFSRQAMSSLVRIYLKQDNQKKLIKILSDIKKRFPDDFESEIENIISFFADKYKKEAKNFEKALFSFLKLLKNYFGYEISERIYLCMGEKFESYKDFAKALEIYKRAKDSLISSVSEKALYHLAVLYEFKLNDYPNAISTYQEILKRFPKETSCEVTSGGHLQCGNASIEKRIKLKIYIADLYKSKMKDYERALEIYQEVVTECEGLYIAEDVKEKIGKIYEIQHKYLDAAKVYEESKNINMHLISAYFYIRYGNSGKGDFDQARKILQKALELCKKRHYSCSDRRLPEINILLSVLGDKKFKKVVRDFSFVGLDLLWLVGTNVTIAYDGNRIEVFRGKFNMLRSFDTHNFTQDSKSPALQVDYNGINVVFLNPSETVGEKYLVDEILNFPKGFLKGLQMVLVSSKPSPPSLKRKLGGRYVRDKGNNLLIIYRYQEGSPARWMQVGDNIHELMHHWDFYITTGPKDPSRIYYSISWSPSPQGGYQRLGDDLSEFFGERTSLKEYAASSPSEDFACAGASYVTAPQEFRNEIRKNMEKGKFELAVKYLFIKYVTPWEGKEFGITQDNPGLDFAEVEDKLKEALTKSPGSVRVTTIKALEEIKKIYMWKQGWGCGGCVGCQK